MGELLMICVTGGKGNIGRFLCQKLAKMDREVLSISRSTYEPTGYQHVSGDITDKRFLENVIEEYDVDCVIHMAAMTYTASRNAPETATKINVIGSLNLLEICKDRDIRVIYGSSVNAMGSPIDDSKIPMTETMPSIPSEFYGFTKRFVEMLGIAMAETGNLDFISARIPVVVGPGQGSKSSPWREEIFTKIKSNDEINIGFSPDQCLPLAHIYDVVDAIIELIESKQYFHKIYNLPCEPIRIGELVRILQEINPNLDVKTGEKSSIGIPDFVDWERFKAEFNYELVPIKDRLIMLHKS